MGWASSRVIAILLPQILRLQIRLKGPCKCSHSLFFHPCRELRTATHTPWHALSTRDKSQYPVHSITKPCVFWLDHISTVQWYDLTLSVQWHAKGTPQLLLLLHILDCKSKFLITLENNGSCDVFPGLWWYMTCCFTVMDSYSIRWLLYRQLEITSYT